MPNLKRIHNEFSKITKCGIIRPVKFMKKRVILLDGNSLMFRAYYATAYTGNLMQTSTGLYTNALYGFVNMMNKILDTIEGDHMLVAFDKGKKTFRHQQLESYKGTRKKMPEELAMQIPLIKEYLDVMGIKRLELDDYEADDIVGSMAKLASNQGYDVICLSGDKDLLQLVSDKVTVCLTKKGITELDELTKENFKDKMGFEPVQMIDYKAMIGDNSDNLEGVKGIGPKTAVSLLEKYYSLDGVYENIDALTPKAKQAFIDSKEVAYQTKFLATIYQDIEFDFTLDDILINQVNYGLLRSFFEKVEFTSFIKKMKIENTQPVDEVSYNEYINQVEQLEEELKKTNEFYFDVELDGENHHRSNVLGFSFLVNNNCYFIEKGHFLNSNLNSYLEDDTIIKHTLDSKKVYLVLKYLGINITSVVYDFLVAVYLVNPSFTTGDLKSIFEYFKNVKLEYHEEVYGKKTKYQIPDLEVFAKYGMHKLIAVKETEEEILNSLVSDGMDNLYYTVELPLATVLGQIEYNGFKVDKTRLNEIGIIFEEKIKELQMNIYELIGKEFNISSPKQLGVILFEELKIGKGKKNKTGYSTSAEILESLRDEHPVIPLILEYRKYSKLYSTYVQGLSSEIFSDGKVHTTFKQTLTQTGRLSSTEPNIQNIPIRTEVGKIIRSVFVPSTKDGMLLSADYSQIELRILAEMANCETMIKDFNNGLDLHASTAAKINNVSYEEVTKDMRRMAKAVNFGIVYGMSDWGLSETLHILPIDAAIFIDKYFAIYPEIKVFLDSLVKDATAKGYSTTLFGRRRYITELASSNHALKKFGERTSMNAPIQGTAADIIKMAMVKVQAKLEEMNLTSKIVAQVHDELIIDTVKDEIEIVKKILKEEMENVVNLKVKLDVDVEIGSTWDLK